MIIFGRQCFEYVLSCTPSQIEEVYLAREISSDLLRKIQRHKIKILRIDNKKAQALSKGRNHQGMLAKISDLKLFSLKRILEGNCLLVLCGLSDIGNIGAIIRTAYALGVNGVILCDRESLTQSALEGIFRASSGALLNMPFCFFSSSLEVLNQLKNLDFTLIGAGMRSEIMLKVNPCATKDSSEGDSITNPLWHGDSNRLFDSESCEIKINAGINCNNIIHTKKSLLDKWALFIGREDSGLKQKLLKKLDKIIHIKMANHFDSLNASVAAGILIDRIQHSRMMANEGV